MTSGWKLSSATVAALGLLLVGGSVNAGNWVGFHHQGNASLADAKAPLKWNPSDVAWEFSIDGYGQSAPVVWDKSLYITSVSGDQKEKAYLTSLNTQTGKVNWKKEFATTVQGKNDFMHSRAAPTPLVDKDGVYVFFESGDLKAFGHDGDKLWSKAVFDDKDNAYKNGHGYGASPAQTENEIILLVDHAGPSYLQALSKKTGEQVWKTKRDSRSSWCSPKVATINGKPQVVVSSNGSVDGYDAASGKQLWSFDKITGNTVPSAVVANNRVYVGASTSRRGGNPKAAAESNCCITLSENDKPAATVAWKANKATCGFTSPTVHQGYVYIVNKVGVLFCLDAESGKEYFAERLSGGCWAQPVGIGKHVYFFGKDGVTDVIKAGEKFEKVAKNELWKITDGSDQAKEEASAKDEAKQAGQPPRRGGGAGGFGKMDPLVYGVAVADDALFFRTGSKVYCVRNKAAK